MASFLHELIQYAHLAYFFSEKAVSHTLNLNLKINLSHSVHSIWQTEEPAGTINSPMKPVNLLPEVPELRSSGRTLSDREKRDYEVIGKNIVFRNSQRNSTSDVK